MSGWEEGHAGRVATSLPLRAIFAHILGKVPVPLLGNIPLDQAHQQCSPCKLKGVVQSTRQEQAICTVAEGQATDLLAVDRDILAALQVDSTHHLNSTA